MFATKSISEVKRGHYCCYCESYASCDYCPYYDDMDPTACTVRLNNDIQYYLNELLKQRKPTEKEQPHLPGLG